MTTFFRKAALTAGVLVASAAASMTIAGTASAAPAYNFPFPTCHSVNYYDVTDDVNAIYDHEQNSPHLYFYKIYVHGVQPDPAHPQAAANWASCVPNDN